jgi:hypothetical protein
LAWSYDALGRVIGKSQTVGSGTSAITKSVGYTYTNADLTSAVTPDLDRHVSQVPGCDRDHSRRSLLT